MEIALPAKVKYIIDRLNANGFAAYAVGGCIRDALIGRPPNDWDVCTAARPGAIREIFRERKQVLSGMKHGTVGVILSGELYEVTTFRVDGKYADHRRPESVRFVEGVEGDLARRDFTVNAMAYSPDSGLIDLFGGQKDIKNKLIRCVGEPYRRFSEDALRMLRALRFAAVLGFAVHEDTKKGVMDMYGSLGDISQERKTAELKGILEAEKCSSLIKEYHMVFSFITGISPDEVKNRADALDSAPAVFALRLGMLMGKREELGKLRLSNAELALAYAAAENMDASVPRTLPEARRMIHRLGGYALPVLRVMPGNTAEAESLLCEAEKTGCCSVSGLKIKGRQLAQAGFKGRQIGDMLNALLFEVMDEKLPNDADALLSRAQELRTKLL